MPTEALATAEARRSAAPADHPPTGGKANAAADDQAAALKALQASVEQVDGKAGPGAGQTDGLLDRDELDLLLQSRGVLLSAPALQRLLALYDPQFDAQGRRVAVADGKLDAKALQDMLADGVLKAPGAQGERAARSAHWTFDLDRVPRQRWMQALVQVGDSNGSLANWELRDALELFGQPASMDLANALMALYDGGAGGLEADGVIDATELQRMVQDEVLNIRSGAAGVKLCWEALVLKLARQPSGLNEGGAVDAAQLQQALATLGLKVEPRDAQALVNLYDRQSRGISLNHRELAAMFADGVIRQEPGQDGLGLQPQNVPMSLHVKAARNGLQSAFSQAPQGPPQARWILVQLEGSWVPGQSLLYRSGDDQGWQRAQVGDRGMVLVQVRSDGQTPQLAVQPDDRKPPRPITSIPMGDATGQAGPQPGELRALTQEWPSRPQVPLQYKTLVLQAPQGPGGELTVTYTDLLGQHRSRTLAAGERWTLDLGREQVSTAQPIVRVQTARGSYAIDALDGVVTRQGNPTVRAQDRGNGRLEFNAGEPMQGAGRGRALLGDDPPAQPGRMGAPGTSVRVGYEHLLALSREQERLAQGASTSSGGRPPLPPELRALDALIEWLTPTNGPAVSRSGFLASLAAPGVEANLRSRELSVSRIASFGREHLPGVNLTGVRTAWDLVVAFTSHVGTTQLVESTAELDPGDPLGDFGFGAFMLGQPGNSVASVVSWLQVLRREMHHRLETAPDGAPMPWWARGDLVRDGETYHLGTPERAGMYVDAFVDAAIRLARTLGPDAFVGSEAVWRRAATLALFVPDEDPNDPDEFDAMCFAEMTEPGEPILHLAPSYTRNAGDAEMTEWSMPPDGFDAALLDEREAVRVQPLFAHELSHLLEFGGQPLRAGGATGAEASIAGRLRDLVSPAGGSGGDDLARGALFRFFSEAQAFALERAAAQGSAGAELSAPGDGFLVLLSRIARACGYEGDLSGFLPWVLESATRQRQFLSVVREMPVGPEFTDFMRGRGSSLRGYHLDDVNENSLLVDVMMRYGATYSELPYSRAEVERRLPLRAAATPRDEKDGRKDGPDEDDAAAGMVTSGLRSVDVGGQVELVIRVDRADDRGQEIRLNEADGPKGHPMDVWKAVAQLQLAQREGLMPQVEPARLPATLDLLDSVKHDKLGLYDAMVKAAVPPDQWKSGIIDISMPPKLDVSAGRQMLELLGISDRQIRELTQLAMQHGLAEDALDPTGQMAMQALSAALRLRRALDTGDRRKPLGEHTGLSYDSALKACEGQLNHGSWGGGLHPPARELMEEILHGNPLDKTQPSAFGRHEKDNMKWARDALGAVVISVWAAPKDRATHG